jgi:hypothetical protein
VKVLAKTVYRIERYGQLNFRFSIVRKTKPRRVGFSSFSFRFPSPACRSRLCPEYKYGVETSPRQGRRARVGPIGTKISYVTRHKWDLIPVSPPAGTACAFYVFPLFAVRRTPIRKSLVCTEVRENCTIRFLPGKLAVISTYSSFFLVLLAAVPVYSFRSSVPVYIFQVI